MSYVYNDEGEIIDSNTRESLYISSYVDEELRQRKCKCG